MSHFLKREQQEITALLVGLPQQTAEFIQMPRILA
jgi:hypothetical protein